MVGIYTGTLFYEACILVVTWKEFKKYKKMNKEKRRIRIMIVKDEEVWNHFGAETHPSLLALCHLEGVRAHHLQCSHWWAHSALGQMAQGDWFCAQGMVASAGGQGKG